NCISTLTPQQLSSTLVPYTTLFRSRQSEDSLRCEVATQVNTVKRGSLVATINISARDGVPIFPAIGEDGHGKFGNSITGGYVYRDRKSTRLNSSHVASSYAVFCLTK